MHSICAINILKSWKGAKLTTDFIITAVKYTYLNTYMIYVEEEVYTIYMRQIIHAIFLIVAKQDIFYFLDVFINVFISGLVFGVNQKQKLHNNWLDINLYFCSELCYFSKDGVKE